jgi:hypothetical protein
MTPEEMREMNRELATLRSRMENLCSDLKYSFGAESRPVFRAEEALDAVKRLEWELQREQAKPISRASSMP